MKVNLDIPKNKQFQSFYLFAILVSVTTGVEMIGTPRIVFLEAGHDAWISIIISYLLIVLLLFIMLYILKQYENADILGIHADLFGNFIAKLVGTLYFFHFSTELFAALLIYIEIIKVFIFPDSNSFILGLMLISLIIYTVLGGLRVVIGVCFIFMICSYWLVFLLIDPLRQMELINFLPIMDRSVTDVAINGVLATSYTFTGFEVLFFIYPFIQNKERVKKPLFLGISWVAFLVLLTTIISIGFFNPAQLERRIWVVLSLFKIQTSPIVERLDYVVVAEWMMITIPRAVILMWCIIYILKRIYNIPKKISLYTTLGIVMALIPFTRQYYDIQTIIETSKYFDMGIVYIYPLILLPIVIIKQKIKKKRGGKQHAES